MHCNKNHNICTDIVNTLITFFLNPPGAQLSLKSSSLLQVNKTGPQLEQRRSPTCIDLIQPHSICPAFEYFDILFLITFNMISEWTAYFHLNVDPHHFLTFISAMCTHGPCWSDTTNPQLISRSSICLKHWIKLNLR